MRNDLTRHFAVLLLTIVAAWTVVAAADVAPRGTEPPVPSVRFDPLFDDLFRLLLDDQDLDPFGPAGRTRRRDGLGLSAVKTRVEDRGDAVVLEFDIPGLDRASVKLDVDRGGVRLTYDARTTEEKTDARGRVVARRESSSRFEKVVPVPPGADPDKYRVEKKGETIRLIFEARASGVKT